MRRSAVDDLTRLSAAINPAGCGENVGRWAHKTVPLLFGALPRRAAAEFLGGVIKALLRLEPGIDVLEIAHVELALWNREHGLPRDAGAADRHNYHITDGV
jgi:hypothetical protein